MSREKPKNFYIAKPNTFGNGAKLKAYKKHIDKEMIIMTKELWDKKTKELWTKMRKKKSKPMSEKEEKEMDDWLVENYEID